MDRNDVKDDAMPATGVVMFLRREFQRLGLGPSNKLRVALHLPVFMPLSAGVSMPSEVLVEKAEAPDRLEFEYTESAVPEGRRIDVHRLRCLDNLIGQTLEPWRGQGPVPEKVVAELRCHIADFSKVAQRLCAHKFREPDTKVTELRYVNAWPHTGRGLQRQEIGRILLGRREP